MSATLSNQLTAADAPSAEQNITNNTTCLILHFGSIAVERKVAKGKIKQKGKEDDAVADDAPVEIDADKELVRVTKRLIDSPEFDKIGKDRRAFTRWLRGICVPSMFKEGIYRVSFRAVTKVAEKLDELRELDAKNIESFLNVYQQRCNETRTKLAGLGEAMDYPPLSRVREAFYIESQWMTFATDERLREQVSEEFFQQAMQDGQLKMTQATDAIITMMRTELQEMVDHLVDVLKPEADGTKKRFHATTVTKIKDFLNNFSLRNVTGDAQLDVIVRTANQLLDGVDAEDLRKNEAQASNTLNGMSMVKQCLDALVTEAGSRRIRFAPQPAAAPEPEPSSELEGAFAGIE